MNDGKDDGQQLVESNGQDVKASCRCGNIRITSGDDLDGKPFHIHRRYPELTIAKAAHQGEHGSRNEHRRRSSLRKPINQSISEEAGSTADITKDVAAEDEDEDKTLCCTVCGTEVAVVNGKSTDLKVQSILSAGKENLSEKTSHPSLLYGLDLRGISASTSYGALPNPPVSQTPSTYLSPLPDPFFLPAPFTPSDPYFETLALKAVEHIRSLREGIDKEISEFVAAKRKLVAEQEGKIRAECEAIWAGYDKADRTLSSVEDKNEADVPAQERRRSLSGNTPAFSVGSMREQRGFLASRSPENGRVPNSPFVTGPDDVAGPSLLSVSMSTSHFPALLSQDQDNRQAMASSSLSPSPQPPQSPSPRSPRGSHQENPITAPIHLPKYGPDKDIASSLMISHLEGMSGPNSRFQDSPEQFSSRRKQRGFNPLDVDMDETDPAELDPDKTRLDAMVAAEPEVRPGGEGDINLNPFAESTQASAASSYKSEDMGDDKLQSAARGRRESKDERLERRLERNSRTRSSFDDEEPPKALEKSRSPRRKEKEKGKLKTGDKKKSVTFQTPDEPSEDTPVQGQAQLLETPMPQYADLASAGTDDAVFDFELHERSPTQNYSLLPTIVTQDPDNLMDAKSPEDAQSMQQNTALVQSKLVSMMAADTPSHRAAWRNNPHELWEALNMTTDKRFIYRSNGKGADGEKDDQPTADAVDDAQVSLLATSVPVNIAMPRRSRNSSIAFEPKTSLTDRQGTLVPGLRQAMSRVASDNNSKPVG